MRITFNGLSIASAYTKARVGFTDMEFLFLKLKRQYHNLGIWDN